MHEAAQPSAAADQFRVLMSLMFNVVSSVGVIFINKRLVFQAAGYHFPTALTIIHFVVCFIGCLGFARGGFFEWKTLPLSRVVGISLAFCGYVVFNNLSLLTNSVSVYQISKILVTPVLIALEFATSGKTQSWETLLSLVPVCLGIGITVYSDSELNYRGTFWALLAVVANAYYTMWGSTKQKELDVTPMQILSYQAPMSAVILCFTLPIFEPWHELADFHYSGLAVTYIVLSCIFAFGVNFSFFLSVGKTSPLTINVLGYLKTCLVFVGGFVFFDTAATWQNILGISMAMFGFALYTKSKMPASSASAAASAAAAVAAATSSATQHPGGAATPTMSSDSTVKV
jgi:solute carrier family 35 protein E3